MSLKDRMVMTYATWFGVGYFPFASGTAATAAALLLPWASARMAQSLGWDMQLWAWPNVVMAALLFFPGVAAADSAERITGEHDSHKIVVDEVVGTLLTLGFLPYKALLLPWALFWGFLLFRILDVAKPYPIHQSQILPHGWGVMVDDALAGLIGGVLLSGLWHWAPFLFAL
jgi:phosphatidylglycerophosphatase A